VGIESSVELARSLEGELGSPTVAKRRWAVTLDSNTLQNNPLDEAEIIEHLGLGQWGSSHPTLDGTGGKAYLGLIKVSVTERFSDSPYHVEVVAEYSFETGDALLAPTERRADWVFESQSGQVPALFYYYGSGNNTKLALTNSAGDYYEGLLTEESIVKITITKNFWPFPSALFLLQNYVNSDTYLDCQPGQLKCVGVNADYTREFFANQTYQHWVTQIVLQFRQSGWALQLPDVGWNYIADGVKRRAMVFDYENNEWVASANVIALQNGVINLAGVPNILSRRVNPEAAFEPLLGNPPTDGLWPIGGL